MPSEVVGTTAGALLGSLAWLAAVFMVFAIVWLGVAVLTVRLAEAVAGRMEEGRVVKADRTGAKGLVPDNYVSWASGRMGEGRPGAAGGGGFSAADPYGEDDAGLLLQEAQALEEMGLGLDADRTRLRRRYSELVRRYHPDRNGGDRKFEARLGRVVEAYQLLRKSSAMG